MKKILFLFAGFVGLSSLAFGQAEWEKTKGPEGGTVYSLARHNNIVYACAGGGLWTSADEGAHWTRTTVLSEAEVPVAVYVGGDEMVIISYEVVDEYVYPASVYRSADGGQTWQKMAFDYDVEWSLNWDYPHIWRQGNILWFRSGLGDLLKSTDNGASWTTISEPPVGTNDYVQAMAVSGDQVLAYSYYNVWRSSDGGASWQATAQDTSYNVQFPYNDGDLLIRIDGDSILRSDDFGYTWQGDSSKFSYLQSQIFRTQDGRFAVLDSYLWLSDDGIHWQQAGADRAHCHAADIALVRDLR